MSRMRVAAVSSKAVDMGLEVQVMEGLFIHCYSDWGYFGSGADFVEKGQFEDGKVTRF